MEIVKYGVNPQLATRWKKQFQDQGFLHIKNFFDPFLADYFRQFITGDNIQGFYDAQPGVDHKKTEYSFSSDFIKEYHLLLNQKNFIEFLEFVTGFPIGCMCGSAYINDKSKKRGLLFHTDDDGNRYFLMSINISGEKYEGGMFTMRDAKTHKTLFQVDNSDSYGILLAPIRSDIEHEVADVTNDVKRIALVGFGLKQPVFKRLESF
jgi:hypothetical protein